MTIHYSSNRTVRKETGDEGTERRIESIGGLFRNYRFMLDYGRSTAEVSLKFLKEDDQDSVRKARSPVDLSFQKPYWQSGYELIDTSLSFY